MHHDVNVVNIDDRDLKSIQQLTPSTFSRRHHNNVTTPNHIVFAFCASMCSTTFLTHCLGLLIFSQGRLRAIVTCKQVLIGDMTTLRRHGLSPSSMFIRFFRQVFIHCCGPENLSQVVRGEWFWIHASRGHQSSSCRGRKHNKSNCCGWSFSIQKPEDKPKSYSDMLFEETDQVCLLRWLGTWLCLLIHSVANPSIWSPWAYKKDSWIHHRIDDQHHHIWATFKHMIEVAARATRGVKIPGRKQTRQATVNIFKKQMQPLRDCLNVCLYFFFPYYNH